MALGIRPPAFVGAYPDYATAKAHAPRDTPNSYDDDQVAPLNFELMSQLHIWDYPVVFWLGKLMQPGLHVVDAGGHFGTKYIAFRDLLPLAEIRWSVQDLPAVIRASRAAQQRGAVPAEVNFIDALLDGGRQMSCWLRVCCNISTVHWPRWWQSCPARPATSC